MYIASHNDAQRLRDLIPTLDDILFNIDDTRVNYAFVQGKNCALNALQHIGYRYTLSLDLKDFFASVRREHVSKIIPGNILDQCLINGVPHQGLPTSPLIATIAFLACDRKILELLRAINIDFIYTRYADDLTFSFNDIEYYDAILGIARQCINEFEFKINERKTRLQDAKNGRVIITGIAIHGNDIQPTRRTLRNIRAAKHQNNLDSLRGLIEWSKCKLPRSIEKPQRFERLIEQSALNTNKLANQIVQTWTPSWLGRIMTGSPDWHLHLNGSDLSLTIGSRTHIINGEEEATYKIHLGILWTDITFHPQCTEQIKVDGLPNQMGAELRHALTDLVVAKRNYDEAELLLKANHSIEQWLSFKTSYEQRALRKRRWFTFEMQAAVLAARPSIDINAIQLRLNTPAISNLVHPEVKKSLEASLQIWNSDLTQTWDALNEAHTKRELKNCKQLLSNVETKPLTEEQARAVICFDNRVQVVAAAGSGKTSTMVAKAAYAIHRKFVAPERIVMLAFNKQAAEELKERAAKSFARLNMQEVAVEASTFHALGLRIIGNATGEKPDIPEWAIDSMGGLQKLTEIVDQLKDGSSVFRANWDMFRFVFGKDLPKWGSRDVLDVWDSDGNGRIRTAQGESVKSQEEVMIANWLFYNGVEYQYEKAYIHRTVNSDYRQYKPDFYYPALDLYHEHFALDGKGQAPAHFKDYIEGVKWKRQLHKEKGTALFETTSHGLRNGNDFQRLAEELTSLGIVLDPNPDREVSQLGQKPMESAELIRLVRTFISHAKSNCLEISALHARLNEMPDDTFKFRHRMFLDITGPILDAWDAALATEGGIDFEDMLNMAAEHLESGRYVAPYELVLADEFQDASRARARLCRALVNDAGRFLFAVGDDWQSINRFAGADVSVMTGFREWFGQGQVLKLEQTFRCPQALCDVSSKFVAKNPSQIAKQVRSITPPHGAVLQAFQVSHTNKIVSAIEQFVINIAEGVKNGTVPKGRDGKVSIYVLGRYNADRQFVPPRRSQFDRFVNVSFLTIHRSKGSEADYVVLPQMLSPLRGRSFPNTRADDPVLALAMPAGDDYPFSEERRLFYVALTRARRSVAMFTAKGQCSIFLRELEESGAVLITDTDGEVIQEENCPACKQGVLVLRSGPYGEFRSCSNFPLCAYKPKKAKTV